MIAKKYESMFSTVHAYPLHPLLLGSCKGSSFSFKDKTAIGSVSLVSRKGRRSLNSQQLVMNMFSENVLTHDVVASAVTAGGALTLLRFWDEMAKRNVFDQKLNRKLVHVSVGLVFMLFWPLFSYGPWASSWSALAPGINIIRVFLVGLGVLKNKAMIKSMSRYGDYRELLKGPLYYACTITIATLVFWRSSPIGLSAICNLCAGDGIADIVGRRFGSVKLPYNTNKSYAGTTAMAIAGFIASVMYMFYFSWFGFCECSWSTVVGFLVTSLAASLVESLPISTELDDNLTVPLTSVLVGYLMF